MYQARSSRREMHRLRSSCRCRSAQASKAFCSSATSLEGTHSGLSIRASRPSATLAPAPAPSAALGSPARAAGRQQEGGSHSSRFAASIKSRPFRAIEPPPFRPGYPIPSPGLRPRLAQALRSANTPQAPDADYGLELGPGLCDTKASGRWWQLGLTVVFVFALIEGTLEQG